MQGKPLFIALINIFSLLYLSFTLAFILGVAEHDQLRKIAFSTLRRWVKLVGALVILSVFVHIISSIY